MDKFKFSARLVLVDSFLVIFMSGQTLHDYLCRYMDEKSDELKGCLLAALESKEGFLSILVESLGSPVVSEEENSAELLTKAGLFWEEERITRDGRNRYKLFHLTDKGRRVAEQTKDEGFDGKIAENMAVA
jgi:hypothetical protein